MNLQIMLYEIRTNEKISKNKIVVGTLSEDIISFLKDRDIPIHTKEIYLTSKGLSHLARDSKKKRGAGLSDSDILNIPNILKNPSAIYFDESKNKLNLLYCKNREKCEKFIKVVVDTKGVANRNEKITIIKTAGYVEEYNIKDMKNYIIVD